MPIAASMVHMSRGCILLVCLVLAASLAAADADEIAAQLEDHHVGGLKLRLEQLSHLPGLGLAGGRRHHEQPQGCAFHGCQHSTFVASLR